MLVWRMTNSSYIRQSNYQKTDPVDSSFNIEGVMNICQQEEQRLAVEAEEEESQDVEMGAGFRNDGPGIPSSHLRRLPGAPNDNDDNMVSCITQ